ncbi:PDZ domain-containing protein 4, partial [Clonorchis sinensis]
MDFVILKVNGQDLRNATHEQAIQAFCHAQEPIMVEVSRRDADYTARSAQPKSPDVRRCDAVNERMDAIVQTEASPEEATLVAMAAAACTAEEIRAALGLHSNNNSSSNAVYSSAVSGLLDIVELAAEEDAEDDDLEDDFEDEEEECIYQMNELFPVGLSGHRPSSHLGPNHAVDCKGHELQTCPCKDTVNAEYDRAEVSNALGISRGHIMQSHFQTTPAGSCQVASLAGLAFLEVSLSKSPPDEKFGLTLCYQNGEKEDDECEVYVGEIEPNSVASRGAGLVVGDRIIKINGQLIRTRRQVVELFRASTKTAALLIGRHAQSNGLHAKGVYIPSSKESTPLLMQHGAEELAKPKAKECPNFC